MTTVALLGSTDRSAWGAIFIDTTHAEALESAALVMQATVVEISPSLIDTDGDVMPVRYHLLEVGPVYVGSVSGDRLRLVLPGGELPDGRRVVVPGAPPLNVGDQFLAVFQSNGDDIIRIDRWKTGWFMRLSDGGDGVATTAWGDPIVSIPCDAGAQVARPWPEAASASVDGLAESAVDVDLAADANPVFVDAPESVALSWTEFIADYQACIAAVDPPGSSLVGTTSDVGGTR